MAPPGRHALYVERVIGRNDDPDDVAGDMIKELVALGLVAFTYREPDRTGEPHRSVGRTFSDMFRLFGDVKFVTFILIFAGFDLMFWQLYISIPTYIVTTISESAPMELIVAINPLMIIIFQLPVARAVMKMKAINTMALARAMPADNRYCQVGTCMKPLRTAMVGTLVSGNRLNVRDSTPFGLWAMKKNR
jgi:hypothetical protein